MIVVTCTDLDHEALMYHGHTDCLNDHSKSGPYHWLIYTWPCRSCGGHFARMLVAERRDENGDWAGATANGPTFRIPDPEPVE